LLFARITNKTYFNETTKTKAQKINEITPKSDSDVKAIPVIGLKQAFKA
jgi:hypothetical protein